MQLKPSLTPPRFLPPFLLPSGYHYLESGLSFPHICWIHKWYSNNFPYVYFHKLNFIYSFEFMQIQKHKKIYRDMSSYNLVPLLWTCVMFSFYCNTVSCVSLKKHCIQMQLHLDTLICPYFLYTNGRYAIHFVDLFFSSLKNTPWKLFPILYKVLLFFFPQCLQGIYHCMGKP